MNALNELQLNCYGLVRWPCSVRSGHRCLFALVILLAGPGEAAQKTKETGAEGASY